MKTIIVYATNSGASFECAKLIQKELPACDLYNLETDSFNLQDYDRIILGAGVKNNTIYKPMRDFLKENLAVLLTKELALFICNGKPKSVEEILNKVFKPELREHALFAESFGGYKQHWLPLKEDQELRGIDIQKVEAAISLLKET
ncbi:flavodoxin domain-containing protein [Enterococcus hulanensis]|uniref:Flavodoxin domain-containing protein n=1 Tax=Enterococcus hulanensis TaxID=2559929 RepID=A0ABU3F262_9ENTE|nr:flavodoxin domain-containing protein [Enterococcus hulanensis]MDT2600256.1 flavodoxin domain-containing protein [Enterococcus hulanensis]MDT2609069.1 flavodoxin domain-containing protein [Enterococcus hulanensis]MDT2616889.1 flavodoxin domain-containing protein [Enterococcus hulanensis]MDT2628591.1 flavodoxin domain-containing protein [Enterococcus hulanensis]MDT2655931.1 flavodoxin domain-containing protein [Enterococcus hulanensis]